MSSDKIYSAIDSFVHNHDFKLKNVYVHAWEADSFSVTSSKYTYEIEVKVSRSDFFADFKKPKHTFFKNYKLGFGNLPDGEWCHNGYRQTNFNSLKYSGANCPNKFFYAVPVGLIEAHEIPKYAGLIYVMDSGSHRVIKQAPFLHKETFNHKTMLFNKYYYEWEKQRMRIFDLERDVEYYKEQLKTFQQTTNICP